jgi:hypothetical protein
MSKFPITKGDMLQRERTRLNSLTRLQLFDECYGNTSAELIGDLMEHYGEELGAGNIVPCALCGCDASAQQDEEVIDGEWHCEDCSL